MDSFVVRLGEHLERTALIPTGARVLVGYSGGPDSTALVTALHALGIDVVAGYLHHGMRGVEADRELELCRAYCEGLDIPFAAGRADVPRMSKELKIGLEEAGRKARYEFFHQAAFRFQCSRVATAHTRSDHVETVLMNLVRGTGLQGLGGIPASRQEIVRPLLAFDRNETVGFCERQGLWCALDPSNDDVQFSRVRIRKNVLPELRLINPALEEAVERMSWLAREEDDFLNSAAASALEHAEIRPNGSLSFLTRDVEVVLNRAIIASWPVVLGRRAMRLVAATLGASPIFDQIDVLIEMLRAGDDGAVTFEGGRVVAELSTDRVHFRDLAPVAPFKYPLTVPGETYDDEAGWVLTCIPATTSDLDSSGEELSCLVDRDALKANLHFRSLAPGDKFVPLGMTGAKKIVDLMQEAGLTLAARSRMPILCDMVGPFWIPGVRLADRARLTSHTTRALRITLRPAEGS